MSRIPLRKTEHGVSPTLLNINSPEALSSPLSPSVSPKERAEFFTGNSNSIFCSSQPLFPGLWGSSTRGSSRSGSASSPESLQGGSRSPEPASDQEIFETPPLRSPPLVSMANRTFTIPNGKGRESGSGGSNGIVTVNDANVVPYTNNWTQWTVWHSLLMNAFNHDSIQNEAMHPMVHMSKEDFASLVTDAIRKVSSEFEPVDTNFILVKVKKLPLSPTNDRVLYVQDCFCYSKISQKIEIGIDEVMFTGASYDITSKLLLTLSAHEELAQILAACLTSTDLILIRGDLDFCVYDLKHKVLALNQEAEGQAQTTGPLGAAANGKEHLSAEAESNSVVDNSRLDVIRFPIDDYWRHQYKGQVLVEKIVPARFTSNFFTFAYTATEEMITSKCEFQIHKRQYRKPKPFTLEDFFQREISRRFTYQMELPFQMPISRGIGPFEAHRVLMECDNLFSLSATATATKITPPHAHVQKKMRMTNPMHMQK